MHLTTDSRILGEIASLQSKILRLEALRDLAPFEQCHFFFYSRSGKFLSLNENDVPFDLAIESILPYVDEFLLGIDKQSFNQNYNKILNNFLKKTKFKNKIKIYFFDFNSLSTLEMKVRGRWIADANNKILNYCRGEYCFYIQADEVFKKISNDKFKNLFICHPDEIYFNFLRYSKLINI
jgi:hypothetical protein